MNGGGDHFLCPSGFPDPWGFPGGARTALVVGGGGGIGRAVCRQLAVAGHRVAVADLDGDAAGQVADDLAAASVGRAVAVPIDVTDGASVLAGVAEATAALGPIGILVNTAGWDDFVAFVDTDEAFWDRIIDINYTGVLRTCHAVVPTMTEAGFGRIVNVASDAGRVGSSLESVYAGAKGAVIAFTKSLAREVARVGVTANAVCPGPTDTPLIAGMAARLSDRDGEDVGGDRFVERLRRAIPLGRLADPTDVASAVAYLASDDAGYITGQAISVSGGLTMV